jgi:RNA polymerase sigma-70 factor (ECF subfamily)
MASQVRGPLSSFADVGEGVVRGSDPGLSAREPSPDRNVAGVNSPGLPASNRTSRELEAEQDRVLLERAQKGDKLAFKQLVQRHQRRAFAIALGLLRDEQDAKEVVQEAFLRVHRGLDSFQGGSTFFTWLYRIVTNLSIDLLRKPSRRDAELDESREIDESDIPLLSRIDGADPLDVLRRAEIRNKLEAALAALPVYHRGVIVMREVEGMSYEEMAEAMGVSKGTIMSRLFHARQKMQRALADCYAEEVAPSIRRPTS